MALAHQSGVGHDRRDVDPDYQRSVDPCHLGVDPARLGVDPDCQNDAVPDHPGVDLDRPDAGHGHLGEGLCHPGALHLAHASDLDLFRLAPWRCRASCRGAVHHPHLSAYDHLLDPVGLRHVAPVGHRREAFADPYPQHLCPHLNVRLRLYPQVLEAPQTLWVLDSFQALMGNRSWVSSTDVDWTLYYAHD